MRISLAAVAVALALAAAGCAPRIDGAAELARTHDREDASAVARQLAALPGVVSAEVVLRRPVADPLAARPVAATATASVVAIVDDRADRRAIETAARALVATAAPGAATAVVVEVGVVRAELARVGPFVVERGSRTPLRLALGGALALIAALAVAIAYRYRPRNISAQ